MSRINTNVSSLIAQRVLNKNNTNLNQSLQRLSTGLKINSGADNPAGLIASENLRAEQAGITQAIDNAGRASNVIGTAEGGLNEVSSLLTDLQSLVGQSASSGGLSSEEVQANQLQVDSILGTINRIAGSTTFQGTKLLDGNYAYNTSSVTAANFDSLQVNAARLPDGQKVTVMVNVTDSATVGKVAYTEAATSALSTAVTLTIAGNQGTEKLSFANGTKLSAVAAGINAIKDVTGVTASAAAKVLSFKSADYGSDQFVSVTGTTASGDTYFDDGLDNNKDSGSDAKVTVNGASADAKGRDITYRTSDLDVEFKLSTSLNGGSSATFGITGGGATFQLGAKINESNKASIGIQSVAAADLGDSTIGHLGDLASGQTLSLGGGNFAKAQQVIDKAIKQVSQLRGRLGAFQKYTIGSTVNSLNVAYENASAAESAIRDTDFAAETAAMTRSQILSQAATTVLAQANASPQSALTLLRG